MIFKRIEKLFICFSFLTISCCAQSLKRTKSVDYDIKFCQQYIAKEELDSGIRCVLDKLSYFERSNMNNINKHNAYALLGLMYEDKNQNDKSIFYYLKALEYNEYLTDSLAEKEIKILGKLGALYRNIGKYDESIFYLKQKLESVKNLSGVNSDVYVNTLSSLSICYKRKDDFAKAIEYNVKSSIIIEKLYGKRSLKYLKQTT